MTRMAMRLEKAAAKYTQHSKGPAKAPRKKKVSYKLQECGRGRLVLVPADSATAPAGDAAEIQLSAIEILESDLTLADEFTFDPYNSADTGSFQIWEEGAKR